MPETKNRDRVAPFFYAPLYADMRDAAEKCGYALALHGSMARDFDLIAVPWSESATGPAVLVRALSDAIGYKPLAGDPQNGTYPTTDKPHGRLGWPIHLMSGLYIDLSIMPRQKDWSDVGRC